MFGIKPPDFFGTFPPPLRKWLNKEPEHESPYTRIRNRLVDMVAQYTRKRFARKIVSKIPKQTIEKLNNEEKIKKLEEELTQWIERASKRVEGQITVEIDNTVWCCPIGIDLMNNFVYYYTIRKEAIKSAVEEFFSEQHLKKIVG